MKKVFRLVVLLAICLVADKSLLRAEEAKPTADDVEVLIYKKFIEQPEYSDVFYFYIANSIAEKNSQLSVDELFNEFKEYLQKPEIAESLDAIFTSKFAAAELSEIKALLNSDLYRKYHFPIEAANYACGMEAMKILDEIIENRVAQEPASPEITADPEHITAANLEEILSSSEYVIIDVFTTWCGPCKHLAPIYRELNQEYGHLYKFTKLNAEEEDALMEKFAITAFPTLIFMRHGQEVGRQIGFRGKAHFISEMERYFHLL